MDIEATIKAEQARYVNRNVPTAVFASFGGVCVLVAIYWGSVEKAYLVLWLALFAATGFYRLMVCQAFRREELTRPASRRRYRQVLLGLGIAGGLLGIGFFVLLTQGSNEFQLVPGIAMVLVSVAAIFSYGAHYPAFLIFFLPSLLPILFAFALRWGALDAANVVATLLFGATILGVASRFNRVMIESWRLRFENLDLVAQLTVQKEAAVQANLAKSKFLAAASHDLRQPIHAQGLFLEVLARSELTTNQREVLVSARAASAASAEMLNTLLDFSRIEAGVVEAQIRPFHLQPLLNKIENELAAQANAKGLIFRSRETHAAVQSDPVLVELILRNLVSNAIRYTERGGVLLACRRRGNQTLLEVWDTGIGIAASQQQEIFREFHQLGNTERDRHKGLGLGLAIAEGLARTLGHSLTLVSTPQRGSVFRLALPIAQVAVVKEAPAIVQDTARAIQARVLVIDDDAAVREGMLQLLRDWGCECEAVESIEAALSAARANRPDLVISDYRLREQRTGAEAIAALRAEFGAQLPALLITGDTVPERLREAHASGVPLLHKPVSPTQLYQRLVSVLAEAHA